MKDKTISVTTQELWARLFHAPTIDRYLADNSGSCEFPSFSDYITEMCKNKGEKPEQILKRSNIESSFGHRLFSGMRKPSRDTVLQLAFGFELTTDETQQLLRAAQAVALHPKVKRDAVIAFYLHKGKTIVEVQQALYDSQLPLIGGSRNE